MIRGYLTAWYAVDKDVKSKIVVVPVPAKMPDEAPRTVEQALLMSDILGKRSKRLTIRIMRTIRKRRTLKRQEKLLGQTRHLLKWINLRQIYLNKATNLLWLKGCEPSEGITLREKLLREERRLATLALEKLKEISAEMEQQG